MHVCPLSAVKYICMYIVSFFCLSISQSARVWSFYLVQAHCNLHSHDVIVISGMRGMPLFGGLFFDTKRKHWKSECIYIYNVCEKKLWTRPLIANSCKVALFEEFPFFSSNLENVISLRTSRS